MFWEVSGIGTEVILSRVISFLDFSNTQDKTPPVPGSTIKAEYGMW